jgi:hypothetical protein
MSDLMLPFTPFKIFDLLYSRVGAGSGAAGAASKFLPGTLVFCLARVGIVKESIVIGYRTAKFGKVSEYRYRIQALKYRNIGYRIVKMGAQLCK